MISRRLLRIKTIKSLYSHFKSGEENMSRSEREFQTSVSKCYELYVLLLSLITEVADMAEKRIEIAAAKLMPTEADLNPNRRFVNNAAVRIIRESSHLSDLRTRYKLNWKGQDQLIKSLYTAMVEAPYFQRYMSLSQAGFAEDRKMAEAFYRSLEGNQDLEETLEEMSIFWIDDLEFALSHVITTLNSLRSPDDRLSVYAMYKNEEDRRYGETLFLKSMTGSKEYLGYIDSLTENWDFERIAFMDKIIMLAAVCELIQFPSIPVKVTLDEFIEISKYYSTTGSSMFINGILDKSVDKLTAEGKIVKSGRGLLDKTIK